MMVNSFIFQKIPFKHAINEFKSIKLFAKIFLFLIFLLLHFKRKIHNSFLAAYLP